jgi:16S rRNA (cytosine967-C5)-methyltransferase
MKPTTQILSARAQAAALLEAVLGARRTVDEALANAPLVGAEPDQKFARALVLTTLRHLGQIDTLLARYLDKPLPEKRRTVMHALRLGAVQLLLMETPPHAALNETVTLLKQGKDAGLAGLVNAVLQKIAREKPALPEVKYNVPDAVRKRWGKRYGNAAVDAIAAVAATRPPLDVNISPHSPAGGGQVSDKASPLGEAFVALGATHLDAQTLRLPHEHPPVEALPGYDDGAFFVQDVAASYPARLLGDVCGLRVLDLCAAPGGKTAQLALGGAQVTALDRSPARLATLAENMARLKLSVDVVAADALTWEPPAPFDAVLLDAPCSATGTWRRHPEVIHLASEGDIQELAELQRALLTRAWGWVKPGGKLVYCVCSLEREEGEDQVAWFASENADARVAPATAAMEILATAITPEGYVRTRPDLMDGGMDGFFAVCWRKGNL